jgi:hypothetical protein
VVNLERARAVLMTFLTTTGPHDGG